MPCMGLTTRCTFLESKSEAIVESSILGYPQYVMDDVNCCLVQDLHHGVGNVKTVCILPLPNKSTVPIEQIQSAAQTILTWQLLNFAADFIIFMQSVAKQLSN